MIVFAQLYSSLILSFLSDRSCFFLWNQNRRLFSTSNFFKYFDFLTSVYFVLVPLFFFCFFFSEQLLVETMKTKFSDFDLFECLFLKNLAFFLVLLFI